MNYGYCNQALRINLSKNSIEKEALDPQFLKDYLGGRGLNVSRLYEEVPPEIDPLSEENKMFIGVGPLTGTLFPGAARVNFTAKSPQTNILGDSNTGGFLGSEIKFAGFDQIILEGKADQLSYIYIKDNQAEIRSAEHLSQLDTFETQRKLKEETNNQVKTKKKSIILIGGVGFNEIETTITNLKDYKNRYLNIYNNNDLKVEKIF